MSNEERKRPKILRSLGYVPKVKATCPFRGCDRLLASTNTSGWCHMHKRYMHLPERGDCDTCGKMLNRNNTTGLCTPCQQVKWKREHPEKRREYQQNRKRKDREAFLERYRELERLNNIRQAEKRKNNGGSNHTDIHEN